MVEGYDMAGVDWIGWEVVFPRLAYRFVRGK